MTEDTRITWLREQVSERLNRALDALVALHSATWQAEGDGRLFLAEGMSHVRTHKNAPVVIVGARIANHIAANDPQQVTADCEADLILLDLYEAQCAQSGVNAMQQDFTWMLASAITTRATAYRGKPGYEEHWGSGD